ncbi:hypothetical protein [Agrobacterium cavarae]|uniref:hypothetical protein n=1 Tax=Agrobacterium cavarae TaxID=2528239 RepID=UPI002FFC05BF
MNEAIDTTAPAVEQEMICDKVDRLARELSEALPQWGSGQFMAMVYPEGDARGYWFRNVNAYDRKGQPDPVINAIQAYRDGDKAFCSIKEEDWDSHGGQEAVIEKTYGPPMRVLDNWNQPCTSMEGVIAALRHAAHEADQFSCSDSLTSMVHAVLAYLEGARS